MPETYPLAAGTALSIRVTLEDGDGQLLTYLAPGPVLSALVWAGGDRAAFAVGAAWVDPTEGLVDLSILASQTAALASGTYRGRLTVADPTFGQVVAYEWRLAVEGSPGTEVEPPTYCSYDDLLVYGRAWLSDLQTEGDEAGFAAQRGRARAWLEEMVETALPRSVGRGYGLPFGGWGNTTTYLREQLDLNRLVVRSWVIEATAKKALALICETQLGPDDDKFAKLGRRLAAEARSIALAHHVEIADASGNVVYSINLAGGSFR